MAKGFGIVGLVIAIIAIFVPLVAIYVMWLGLIVATIGALMGDRIFTVPYASCKDFEDVGAMLAEYRRGRGAADDDDHVFTFHTHVARSDEEAREQCKAAYDLYVDTRLYAKKHVYEDVLASGLCLFGSVETVARKMRRLHEMGIRHVATMHNFGALSPDRVERSMTLFAREVLPEVPASRSAGTPEASGTRRTYRRP